MYAIGDLLFYAGTGVCRVADIVEADFACAHQKRLCYVLEPLYHDGVIYIPTENPKVFMRPIVARGEAERLIDSIPSIRAQAYHSHGLTELAQHYKQCLRTCDCAEMIRLTMSIHAKARSAQQQKRKLGSVDEAYMKRAEELLFGELAAALGIAKEDVPAYIAQRVGDRMAEPGRGGAD